MKKKTINIHLSRNPNEIFKTSYSDTTFHQKNIVSLYSMGKKELKYSAKVIILQISFNVWFNLESIELF